MIAPINRALQEAIRRAYALGRVDQSIGIAAKEMERIVAADPSITPGLLLQLYGLVSRWSNVPDWDEALWRIADLWCEVYHGLQRRRPPRQLPASAYSVLHYAIPAREAAATPR